MTLTDIADDLFISLKAIDKRLNRQRWYTISRSPELFGLEIIELSWGRMGSAGRSRRLSAAPPKDASKTVRKTLARRSTAKERIGVDYSLAGWGGSLFNRLDTLER